MQPAPAGRPLLIHAHPGHELRLFHWMELNQPTLMLLTDGAGGDAVSRIDFSATCAAHAGAAPGSVFGAAPDRAWYEAILRGDASLFERVIDAAATTALRQRSALIVSDAADGYNPMHDLCEAVGAAAAAEVRRRGGAVIHLVARAIAGDGGEPAHAELRPDAMAMRRKHAAIDAYEPLARELGWLLEDQPDALVVERLFRPSFAWPERWAPEWEQIGRGRVAANRYHRAIEYAAHVLPIARALLGSAAEEKRACAS